MIEVLEKNAGPREQHARFAAHRNGNDPTWLKSIRAAALNEFLKRGFPTTRDEEWRFTNLAPLAKINFDLAETPAELSAADVRRFDISALNAATRMVFVNGRFAPSLSTLQSQRGVRVLPMVQAISNERQFVQPHLEGHTLHAAKADAFTWMNTAFVDDGVVVVVDKGVAVDQPIEILSIAAETAAPVMSHPRNIIIAGENAEVTVVERYVSLGGGVYFTNAVTDLFAEQNATVHHYLIEEEGGDAFNIATLRTRQMRNSNVDSHTMLLGGKLVRNNVHAILDGEGAQCLINGLYIGSEQQHMDNHMRVEHAQPHGDSRQFYKGILDQRASGVFSGRIIVHPGAQKTDAKQTNKNLLLSADAHVDTKPQLEIYADDVKCTHGATIGQMDEQAIFYCRARGISHDTARSMLIHAFAAEALTRMKNHAVRAYIEGILFARLPGGDLLEHML